MSTLLDAALEYAARGWPVFPGHPKTKRPLTPQGKDAEGNADGSGGLKLATTDAAQITAWWTQFPKALIGVRCGQFIGAFAVDFDAGVDKVTGEIFEADQLIARLEEAIGAKLPETWCVVTPRGGRHLYFQAPAGVEITNRGGLLGKDSRIDVRGDNGYVFLPPSARPDGKGYAWLVGPKIKGELPAKAPQALLDCILRQGRWEEKDAGQASNVVPLRGDRASPVGGGGRRRRCARARDPFLCDRRA
jgi:putative DNA primase/helicase